MFVEIIVEVFDAVGFDPKIEME